MEKDLLRWCLDPNDLRFQLFFFKLWMLTFCVNSAPVHCSRDPQISLFSNFFVKNRSHGTIHIFKNYFVTVFLIFNFQLYPNGRVLKSIVTKVVFFIWTIRSLANKNSIITFFFGKKRKRKTHFRSGGPY